MNICHCIAQPWNSSGHRPRSRFDLKVIFKNVTLGSESAALFKISPAVQRTHPGVHCGTRACAAPPSSDSLSRRFLFLHVRLGRVSTHLISLHMPCLILHLVALVCVSGYWKLGIWGRVAPSLPPKLFEGVAAHPAACGGNQLQTSSVVSLVPPALEFDSNGPCAPE